VLLPQGTAVLCLPWGYCGGGLLPLRELQDLCAGKSGDCATPGK